MPDLGAKVAFTAVREGTPVYDARDKRVGVVEEVLADTHGGIFEGILVHTLPLPGRHVLADADQIAALHERGVVLSVERSLLDQARDETRVRSETTERPLEQPLQAKLRHVWDRVTRSRLR